MQVEIPPGAAYLVVTADGEVHYHDGDTKTPPGVPSPKAAIVATALYGYWNIHEERIMGWFHRSITAHMATGKTPVPEGEEGLH